MSRWPVIPRTAQLVVGLLLSACVQNDPPATHQQPFSVCQGGILAALPLIAAEKGYFAAEGIAADISVLGDGKAAMGRFLNGDCDAAVVGEPPIVRQCFDRNDFAIIATVVSSDNATKILALRSRGISSPRDLIGRRVGVSKGTTSHFFLDQFLKKNRIPTETLTVVDISHQDMPEALQRGTIDAFAGSDVSYLKGLQAAGSDAVTFTECGLTTHAAGLVVGKKWLDANQGVARGVLRGLLRAERELAAHPEVALKPLAKRLETSPAELKAVMAEQHNIVTLDHIFLLSLEDQARWMQENGVAEGKPSINFLNFLDPTLLSELKPGAVSLR
ncbi:MAG: transporter substrate-binding domain-containing protein [Geobacter sp.]|nr:transporter substrate-binding domain-containing protein [Geobacter sp.]